MLMFKMKRTLKKENEELRIKLKEAQLKEIRSLNRENQDRKRIRKYDILVKHPFHTKREGNQEFIRFQKEVEGLSDDQLLDVSYKHLCGLMVALRNSLDSQYDFTKHLTPNKCANLCYALLSDTLHNVPCHLKGITDSNQDSSKYIEWLRRDIANFLYAKSLVLDYIQQYLPEWHFFFRRI
ncbi:hypothetical protein P8822_00305 [Bacillus sonorensis]|uniref:hypothetical protein n=1 Tax=Bacillus subtilis group TaxID=653685 RepID=UPI001FD6FA41|nr:MULTISPECIES: hypothetical protein [Bacillus subtilis group]MCJ8223680.1 hypothetical protein [Bacillus paralicheniformis]MEC0526255.1 hypothetical protein [Bacillus sonorensis]